MDRRILEANQREQILGAIGGSGKGLTITALCRVVGMGPVMARRQLLRLVIEKRVTVTPWPASPTGPREGGSPVYRWVLVRPTPGR